MTRSRRSPLYTRLRELLTEARIKSGQTQTELAVRLRRPQSFVAKYEGGERRLDVIEFVEVVTATGGDPGATLATLLRPDVG